MTIRFDPRGPYEVEERDVPFARPAGMELQARIYRVHFETNVYFERNRVEGLYPYVQIVFTVSDKEQHYHIPLLLTANGYTTYRGS